LRECGDAGLRFRLVRGRIHQHPDAADPLRLLRARSERPRHRRAAEERDELAAFHSITSSARHLVGEREHIGGNRRPR
jgi:hypothetical protein